MAALSLPIAAFVLFIEAIYVEGLNEHVFGPRSSCGGSTPWKCPYITFRSTNGCSEMSIKSPAECKTAADTLGYFGTLQQVKDTTRPSGCSVGRGPMDKSFNSKWDQIYFNMDPVGYRYSRAYRSICHNRVEVEGSIGSGRDFPLRSEGRSKLGQVQNVRNGQNRCCQECWAKYPGTQMFEYHSGPSPYFSSTINDVCRCLYKEPGEILQSTQVDSTQSTGICAAEYTICRAGDNMAGRERFIQENEYPGHSNCRDVCQRLYPASVGMTESTVEKYSHGKSKCWCEFGVIQESQVVPDQRYRTCLFDRQF